MSGHQSSSCKGACTDVIRIQTQNDFYCFPSATFEPLHCLLNFIEFFTLIFAGFLSYARVELVFLSLQGFSVECTNGRISHNLSQRQFCMILPILAKIWLPQKRPLNPCNPKCLIWIGRSRKTHVIRNHIPVVSRRNAFIAILVPELVAMVTPLCPLCTGVSHINSLIAQTLCQNQTHHEYDAYN